MSNSTIYDIYWEGPYTIDEFKSKKGDNRIIHEGHCLYQIYGDHPCYGRDVLLYIGKTKNMTNRLWQHSNRYSFECESVKIFVGSCGIFESWEKMWEIEKYAPIDKNILDAIESLLIHAHQPAYNSSKLLSTHFKDLNLRIFNTNKRKSLMPEISTTYYRGNITEEENNH
ncbi:GIY-YIG nuclease family protein [Serratia aquatilis]|uniref:GIY-YIG nuclease family protein n=1 Tax=Serratia aquatilis TaxID=1737515 RepID=A0ABV6EGU6_9GAMM